MAETMQIIDAHMHITPDKAGLAAGIMDAAGIAAAVVCEWFDGFGDALVEHIAQFDKFPGRFFVFGNIDFSRIDAPDFATAAVDDLRRGVDAGMRGLKVYKGLGLEHKDASGRLLRVSDERLDPIWAAAGEAGIPVLMHTADPRAFWEPIDEHNPWCQVLQRWTDWTYYRRGLPSRDELLAERNTVIRRHPGTKFIGPHLGSWEDDFGTLAEMLQDMPNLYVDISARFCSLGQTPARRQAARKVFANFSDRILFGTDSILVSGTADTDIQPQTFLTPERLPERLANAGDDTLVATSVWFYEFHKVFLETDRPQGPVPFLGNDPSAELTGLALSKDLLAKIYHANILRLLGE